jgi:hypothetical protein
LGSYRFCVSRCFGIDRQHDYSNRWLGTGDPHQARRRAPRSRSAPAAASPSTAWAASVSASNDSRSPSGGSRGASAIRVGERGELGVVGRHVDRLAGARIDAAVTVPRRAVVLGEDRAGAIGQGEDAVDAPVQHGEHRGCAAQSSMQRPERPAQASAVTSVASAEPLAGIEPPR